MKKKTKNFYFFNKFKKPPGSQYLFSLFRRAAIQWIYRKNFKKRYKKTTRSFNKIAARRNFLIFQKYFNYNVLRHQWNINRDKLPKLFLHSKHLPKLISRLKLPTQMVRYRDKTNNKTKALFFWFCLKKRYYKNRKRQIRNFKKRFITPSPFAVYNNRSMLNKLFLYNAQFKYNARYFNLRTMEYYVYIYYKWISLYFNLSNSKIFFFTINLSKKNLYVDDFFNVHITNWRSHILRPKQNNKLKYTMCVPFLLRQTINNYDYSFIELKNLMKNRELFLNYISELKQAEKEMFFNKLVLIVSNNNIEGVEGKPLDKLLDVLFITNILCVYVFFNLEINNLLQNKYIIEYLKLYNNNDISTRKSKNTFLAIQIGYFKSRRPKNSENWFL